MILLPSGTELNIEFACYCQLGSFLIRNERVASSPRREFHNGKYSASCGKDHRISLGQIFCLKLSQLLVITNIPRKLSSSSASSRFDEKKAVAFFSSFFKGDQPPTSGDPLKKPIFLTRCCPVVWHPSASYWNHFWGVILTLSRERICNFPTRSFFPSVCLHFRALFTLAIVMCSRKWRFC